MLERARWPEEVTNLLSQLETAGHEAYLVGGCVRDYIMQRPIHDYDVATSALPEQVLTLFPKVKATGLKHGTVTVIFGRFAVEVTTYRVDGTYSDGRHPDKVSFTPRLKDDLARRDFTINAMALDVRGHLFDPFLGAVDISNKALQTVGEPEDRFAEDGLRIMRGIRFSAELNFTLAPRTESAMHRCADQLSGISSERIGQELSRVARSNWLHVQQLLADGPWLSCTVPALDEARHLLRQVPVTTLSVEDWFDLWTSFAPDRGETLKQTAFLAIVLSMTKDLDVRQRVLKSFRRTAWSKDVCSNSAVLAECIADDPLSWSHDEWRNQLYSVGIEFVALACRLTDWLFGSAGRSKHERETRFQQFVETQPIFRIQDLGINGRDIQLLGAVGPEIGLVKTRLVSEILFSQLPNKRSTLTERASILIEEFRSHVDNS